MYAYIHIYVHIYSCNNKSLHISIYETQKYSHENAPNIAYKKELYRKLHHRVGAFTLRPKRCFFCISYTAKCNFDYSKAYFRCEWKGTNAVTKLPTVKSCIVASPKMSILVSCGYYQLIRPRVNPYGCNPRLSNLRHLIIIY
jgi:hypothetical protein